MSLSCQGRDEKVLHHAREQPVAKTIQWEENQLKGAHDGGRVCVCVPVWCWRTMRAARRLESTERRKDWRPAV